METNYSKMRQKCIAMNMKFTIMDVSGMDESKNNCVKFIDPQSEYLTISDRYTQR